MVNADHKDEKRLCNGRMSGDFNEGGIKLDNLEMGEGLAEAMNIKIVTRRRGTRTRGITVVYVLKDKAMKSGLTTWR